uniref:Ig-like domain-containing protein n=1 Tax=Cyprinus carpio TaxID=7962 RepID=A0A8C2ISU3_CYPCA
FTNTVNGNIWCVCAWILSVTSLDDCVFGLTVCVMSVSLQDTVEAFIGGSVILPCSLSAQDLTPKIVFDIIKGKDTVAEQDPQYKNRAETFPDEYLRGNFSLKLNNLQHTDTGKFSCFTTPSNEQKTIQLIINGIYNFKIKRHICCLYHGAPILCLNGETELKLPQKEQWQTFSYF